MTKGDRYRRGVGVMLLNSANKVFVGARIDNTDEAWQMPQGGIDEGENDPWQTALRELEEETGIAPHLVERIADCPERLKYDLPEELRHKLWGGKWKGQDQDWYLVRFLGRERHQHRDEAPRIPRMEVDRARAASRADRSVQARPVSSAAARVRRLSLIGWAGALEHRHLHREDLQDSAILVARLIAHRDDRHVGLGA